MVDTFAKEILVEDFRSVLKKLTVKIKNGHFSSDEKKTKLIKALVAINQAVIQSKNFIKNDGYIDNTQLSKLWHKALKKSINAGLEDGLPEYLYNKASFWGEPSEWLNNQATLSLIPKLQELRELCDDIMHSLK